MKSIFVFLCLALCATVALGGYQSQCANIVKCKTVGSLRINVRGAGSCSAKATAYCSAAQHTKTKCFGNGVKKKTLKCRGFNYVQADSKCYAAAAVEAYTSAAAAVNCKGKRVYGCAEAKGHSKAIACSVARAIVDLLVVFEHHKHHAVCDAAIDVLIPAIAKAATYSRAGVCMNGPGYLADHDYDYAAAFQVVFAKALARCWTYCDKHGEDVYLDGEGEGKVVDEGKFTRGDGAHAFLGNRRRPRRSHGK